MPAISSKVPKVLADICESPSKDEDLPGFRVLPQGEISEDSRDSLLSSEKPVLCFRSKFITSELIRVFTESESEQEEFKGFGKEEEGVELKSKVPRVLADIFESPRKDEDLPGFRVRPQGEISEDSRDSLFSSEKPAVCFRSKFITSELVRVFTESGSEEEEFGFEGFSDEGEGGKLKSKSEEVEESDVDTGFYSEGEESPPPKKKSLCVAFRFPTKRLSAQKEKVPKIRQPITKAPPERRGSDRMRLGAQECIRKASGAAEGKRLPDSEEEEEEEDEKSTEVQSQALRKRDKNIQENKAMLAKLFADLTSMPDLTPPPTPQKRKRVSEKPSLQKQASEGKEGRERRNPSRKARPPENFGVEKRSESPTRLTGPAKTVDLRKLVEVDGELVRVRRSSKGARRLKRSVVRPVDDITQEELDNVAERAKDKVLDKEHGSTCHQCRQKTLDTKTVCRSGHCVGVKGQFCGPCLRNRYGEDVRDTLLDPEWACPLCRGLCNCSLCRKQEGRCATGNLVHLAKFNGHSNVREYLESLQKQLD